MKHTKLIIGIIVFLALAVAAVFIWNNYKIQITDKTDGLTETPAQTTAKCGVENCHGLEITCGPNVADVCTEIYMAGDNCRPYASCKTINGQCALEKTPKFDSCKSCVEKCKTDYGTGQIEFFQCENKCAGPMVDWEAYGDDNFNIKYPSYLTQKIKLEGVKTTIYFEGKIATQSYESLLSVASMPNQSGGTLDDWTDKVISQSKWVKQSSTEISGQPAYILVLPETDAGNRYVFLSENGKTIFDMTVQHFDKDTADLIISSFLLMK
jgi:hypothetical protein